MSSSRDHYPRDRRDDRRDDGRGYRRDDRRSDRRDDRYARRPDDRERDRDRDRDLFSARDRDRRYDDRLPRQDRSRERKRSRERSPVRDRRERDRDGGGIAYRDDSRDRERKRPRRTESIDSKRRSTREDSRDRRPNQSSNMRDKEANHAANKASEEERKKVERQAKLAAWKKKQEEKRTQAEALPATTSRPGSVAPDTVDAASPAPVTPSAAAASPRPESPVVEDASPKPYAGKFDPKAIAKKAAAASSKLKMATLESDIPVPGKSKSAAPPSSIKAADHSTKLSTNGTNGYATSSGRAASNALASGFGLAQSATDDEHKELGTIVDMDDEQVERRKLEKLPTPELQVSGDAALANGQENQDEEVDDDAADSGNEEEQAAAARAAAEKRAALAAATQQDSNMVDAQPAAVANGDVDMADEDEEDVDPLDAYMNDLVDSAPKRRPKLKSKSKLAEPQAMFSDEEGDMEAVGDDDEDILAMATKKKKREIATVNHGNIDYEPFRKNFYTEPLELKEMDEEAVRVLRFEMEDIKVQGADVPKPVQKFAQLGLGTQVLDIIRNLGFDRPTSVQAQAIPAIMSGRDVISVAKTGSGKTVAFLLPMFRHIKDQRPLENMEGPMALVMAPTRELATQIHRECKPYLKALNLRAVCCYGGAPIKDQIAELKRGAEILVCTAGRLVDLLTANQGRVTNLRRVTYFVLDEADRMFDMGFEPQVTKVLNSIRPDRQTVMFSATFSPKMEGLARKALTKPVQVLVGGRSTVASEITQIIEVRPESSKYFRLLELLGGLFDKDEDARALVFVERQDGCDSLLIKLQQSGYPCVSIHGGREQIDRDTAIDDFKRGDIPVMIATSVAARGLDVKQLKLVVNYDVPNHLEDYVHRSGRTGRAGNTGTAVTFITEDQDRYSLDLVKALTQSSQPIPEDLQKLADAFKLKVKEGKEAKSGSGFGGKGLDAIDAKREAERLRERRSYKTGDGDDEEEEKEEKKKDAEKEPKIEVKSRDAPTEQPSSASIAGVPKHIDLDAAIQVHKTEIPAPASNKPLDRVAAAAASINSRLGARNSTRPGVPIDNKGPDAGAYHATLEINDFPQKARWAVTNRTNVAKVLDSTGTSITSKGNFYMAGKEPGPTDAPKLYILVEGDTELQVTNAMRELQRLLKEGTIAAADSDARAPTTGRYTVGV